LLAWAQATLAAQTLLVFGDSLSAPYGIAEKRGWVSLLGERLKKEQLDYRIVNASISGETTSGGRTRLAKVLADHKPAVVILELGGNDGLRGLPVPEMKKNLAAMIEHAQKTGARVLLVGTRMPPNYGPEYAQAYEATFADLAKQHKIALAPDLTAGIGEKLELFLPDRVHPNETVFAFGLRVAGSGLHVRHASPPESAPDAREFPGAAGQRRHGGKCEFSRPVGADTGLCDQLSARKDLVAVLHMRHRVLHRAPAPVDVVRAQASPRFLHLDTGVGRCVPREYSVQLGDADLMPGNVANIERVLLRVFGDSIWRLERVLVLFLRPSTGRDREGDERRKKNCFHFSPC
jgi:acyl-CoA thioesterase-1